MRTEGESWLFGFIGNPVFDTGARRSLQLSKIVGDNPKTDMGGIMTVSGFLGRMIHRYPEELQGWVDSYLAGVEPGEQVRRSILWFALALSDLEEAKQLLLDIDPVSTADAGEQQMAVQLSGCNPAELTIDDEWMLHLLWGLFWGSGDDAYLERIAQCVKWAQGDKASVSQSKLGKTAFYSLAQHQKISVHVQLALSKVFGRDPSIGEAMVQLDSLLHEFDPHTM